MRNIISFISFLPANIFILLPSMCGSLLYKELDPIFIIQILLFVVYPILFSWIFPAKVSEAPESTVVSNYFCIKTFLITLFVEILVCSDQKPKIHSCAQYYLPGFIIELLSPDNLALKLVSITAIFLFVLMLDKKAKELF